MLINAHKQIVFLDRSDIFSTFGSPFVLYLVFQYAVLL